MSNLESQQRIVFFTTDAIQSADLRTWQIPIHAWVHDVERSTVRKAAFAALLNTKYGLKAATSPTRATFDRRSQPFFVDNKRNKVVVIRLAGEVISLPPTSPNGHTGQTLELDAAIVSAAARNGSLTFSAVLPDGDDRTFSGTVRLIAPDGISVISDVDDTVKVTEVTDRRRLLERTFFEEFEAAPGMTDCYQAWARHGATFHFVSSSPWNLYEPLDDFLSRSGFPARSLSLNLIRFKDRTLLNLFKKGTETKPAQIEPILKAFPDRRFVLIGDSGELDPEVYVAMLKKYPHQIQRIYIRNVTEASRGDERFKTAFADVDAAKWELFSDPSTLRLPD